MRVYGRYFLILRNQVFAVSPKIDNQILCASHSILTFHLAEGLAMTQPRKEPISLATQLRTPTF